MPGFARQLRGNLATYPGRLQRWTFGRRRYVSQPRVHLASAGHADEAMHHHAPIAQVKSDPADQRQRISGVEMSNPSYRSLL